MSDPVERLKTLKPATDFFIGIDSDGCVFDTMEIKHKECFCPQFIKHYGLQAASKYARETWEFVNLYSRTRGLNRFPALTRALHLLAQRDEVMARKVAVPALQSVKDWIGRESKLGNPALAAEVERTRDPDLSTTLAWTTAVNEAIKDMVRDVPPFPGVRESLERMQGRAEVVVVSQTPCEALEREWSEHGIDRYVRIVAGQEMGTKTEHISFASGGKYGRGNVLMVGDALGDLKAAKDNNALFYPINPGAEEASWKRLLDEALDRFFTGTYAGEYECALVAEFNEYLPERAPWEKL